MLALEFPRLITVPNSKSVLRLCSRAIRSHESDILFDLTRTEFITPFGVTVIAGAITECLRQGKKVQYRRPREDQVERWLSSISFSRLFHIDEMSAATRSTSTELRLLTSLDPIYIDDLVNLLDANMNLSTGVRDSIKMSVQELLTNVFDHSNSTVGCFVCAQFTPKSQRIRLSVTDFGIGILKALKSVKIYSGLRTSHEAITRAVEEGVSSRQGKMAGFGLTHIRRFMRVNQGTMTVISGDGKVNFYEKSIERRPMPSHFTGTAIELKISADKGGFYFLTDENIF